MKPAPRRPMNRISAPTAAWMPILSASVVSCDPLAQSRQREREEQDAGDGDHGERALPGRAHLLDDDVSEDDVRPHRRRDRERQVGPEPHHRRAEQRRERGRDHEIAAVHAGIGHDRRIDRENIGHRREGRRAGDELAGEGGRAFAEAEPAIEEAGGPRRRQGLDGVGAFVHGFGSRSGVGRRGGPCKTHAAQGEGGRARRGGLTTPRDGLPPSAR